MGLAESKEEEEMAPSLIWSRRSRGLTTSKEVEVAKGPQSDLRRRCRNATELTKHYDASLEETRTQSNY